jgi:hypothetical protein
MSFTVQWLDSGFEPKCAPNPNYPNGKPMDMRYGDEPWCEVNLPYPAKRIGSYLVVCNECNKRIIVTTAGRPDDPTNIKFNCGKIFTQ